MKHKHTETLTKSTIEHDIKALYIWFIKGLIPCVCFLYFGIGVLWFSCDLSKKSNHNLIIDIILILYVVIMLYTTIYLIYLIIQCFKKNIKYTIVSDTFIKIGTGYGLGYGIFGVSCLCFSEHGKYLLHTHGLIYYTWSNLHCMSRESLMNRSQPGDKFYLVIKNKKILYVYNQKIFTLNNN